MHAIKKIACVLCVLWAGLSSAALAQVVPPTGSTPTLGPSDQKAGSVLVFPLVVSNASKTADTRITISNISSKKSATINFYFISENCSELNDPGMFLTPNQSITFAASDLYPVDRGYLIVVAFDPNTNCPIQNNVLMGSAYVKLPSGYLGAGGRVNDGYNAEAFWAYQNPVCPIAGTTALLNFDGVTYDKAPSSFVAQIQQPALSPGQTILTITQGKTLWLTANFKETQIHDLRLGQSVAVHIDALTEDGSSFKASQWKDMVRANDGWFRPTTQLVGPDGALWISDWYDKYPCYQNARADPEGVDREYGRIYRVVHTGPEKGKAVASRPAKDMDLAKLNLDQAIDLLAHDNVWQRRTTQRLLSERLSRVRIATPPKLLELFESGPNANARLAALWTLHGSARLSEEMLDRAAADKESVIRTWAARLTGERQVLNEQVAERVQKLAGDAEAAVRLAAATAVRQFTSGSLTVNTPPKHADADPRGALAELIAGSYQNRDRTLELMIWMAAEPVVVKDFAGTLNWLGGDGAQYMPLTGRLAAKVLRRICDFGERANVDLALQFLEQAAAANPALAATALDGLLEGQKGRVLMPQGDAGIVLAKLVKHADATVRERAQQLGSLWGDASSVQASFDTALDVSAGVDSRLKAIAAVRSQKNAAARDTMTKVLNQQPDTRVSVAAIQALGEIGGNDSANYLIDHWAKLRSAERREAVGVLVTRGGWASSLLSALEQKRIPVTDIPATAIRSMTKSGEDFGMLAKRAEKVFGRVRDANVDKLKLIAAKRKVVLAGTPDLAKGHETAKVTCLTCHKLHGEGAEIGPDLTGVGRSSLDALLANVIDPNQIIGKGYENVVIETKDGRSLSGRLVEETEVRVKLVNLGPTEFVIGKSEIKTRTISEMSLMPEGLEALPDEDFRDLIWYILAPPQDGPLTEPKRRELIGEGSSSASTTTATDGESVALWNPEWRVIAPDFEGTPKKHPEYAGRRNVLETHPFTDDKPSALERVFDVPATGARLTIEAAAHERGDWELRIFANGDVLKRALISREQGVWQSITADLAKYAGQRVVLRLENMAGGDNDWSWEFAYWSKVELSGGALQASR